MPIYEYQCDKCDNIFEVLTLSAKDKGPITCTVCNSDKVAKVISAGSFRLHSGGQPAPPSAPKGCGKGGFS